MVNGVTECGLAMSNQRSFKNESFRFAAFVPKKIEYFRFGNKILDRNKTFSISIQKFWSKSFRFVPFPNIFWDNQKFSFVFNKSWCSLIRFSLVLISFLKIQKFCFDT
jgi:hypothetical protein